jgi:hypothetical protein
MMNVASRRLRVRESVRKWVVMRAMCMQVRISYINVLDSFRDMYDARPG